MQGTFFCHPVLTVAGLLHWVLMHLAYVGISQAVLLLAQLEQKSLPDAGCCLSSALALGGGSSSPEAC